MILRAERVQVLLPLKNFSIDTLAKKLFIRGDTHPGHELKLALIFFFIYEQCICPVDMRYAAL